MNAAQFATTLLKLSSTTTLAYISDFTDADLLVRPLPGANHAAWQLGHLILAERFIAGEIPGVAYPDLPQGFAEAHGKDRAQVADTTGWCTRAEYESLFHTTREATLAAIANLTDAALDQATQSRLKEKAPTLGALLALLSQHDAMHGGQFTAIRRALSKPVLF